MAKNKPQAADAADEPSDVELAGDVDAGVATDVAVEAPSPSAVDAPVVNEAPLLKFRVTVGDKSDVVDAPNEADAWANFCDKHQNWPNPKHSGRTIEQVK